jgi:hypothetical protein
MTIVLYTTIPQKQTYPQKGNIFSSQTPQSGIESIDITFLPYRLQVHLNLWVSS